jgi:hypothetical protein
MSYEAERGEREVRIIIFRMHVIRGRARRKRGKDYYIQEVHSMQSEAKERYGLLNNFPLVGDFCINNVIICLYRLFPQKFGCVLIMWKSEIEVGNNSFPLSFHSLYLKLDRHEQLNS